MLWCILYIGYCCILYILCLQLHNAGQLVKWCLFFISSNYDAFTRRKEWPQLQHDHRQYVDQHRWPPVSYLKEVEQYEALLKRRKLTDKCSLM
jgi:Rho family protein